MSAPLGVPRRLLLLAIFAASLLAFDRLLGAAIWKATGSGEEASELTMKLREARSTGRFDVLVLGTSRAFEAIHPLDITEQAGVRVFKEAFQGKGPLYHHDFYARYRSVVGKPRVVVYAVDYFLFELKSERWRRGTSSPGATAEDGRNGWRWPLHLVRDKTANDRAIVRALQGGEGLLGADGAKPNPERYLADMEAYRGNTMERQGDPPAPEPPGYGTVSFPRFPGEEGGYFEALLRDLEADGVQVLLVGLPDFIATYRTNFEQALFTRTFTEIATRHRNCVFVNYNDPARFPLSNPAYFIDGKWGNPNSHLSKKGVQVFLRLFLPDLEAALDRSS